MGAAVTTPLTDLNIVHAQIPEVLKQAQKQPYSVPENHSCDAIANQLHLLDDVLGADLDTPAAESTPSLLERGTDTAKNEAVKAIARTAEGVVPFRGWVRKLSGAERYSQQVSASITAGTVRRAFLKGLRAAQACPISTPTQLTAAN